MVGPRLKISIGRAVAAQFNKGLHGKPLSLPPYCIIGRTDQQCWTHSSVTTLRPASGAASVTPNQTQRLSVTLATPLSRAVSEVS